MKNMNYKKPICILIIACYLFFYGYIAWATNTYTTVLNGSNQYWSITDVAQTGLDGMTDWTAEFQVNFDTLPADAARSYIVGKWGHPAEASYQFDFNPGAEGNNKLRLQIFDGANYTRGTTDNDAVASAGTWYHIAATHVGATHKPLIYVNGSLVAFTTSGEAATGIQDGTGAFAVGAAVEEGTPSYFIDGKIDDVRVWNVARTGAQIAANYNCSLDGNETGLVGYWRFDNNGEDSTTNNNDLTNNNSATFQSASLPFTNSCTVAAAPVPQDSYQFEEEF